jgi:translation initiation factor IF-3
VIRSPLFRSVSRWRNSLITNDYQSKPSFRPRGNYNSDLVNERIHFKEVLLIGPNGESFGVVPMRVALQKSMDLNMDILCVSPQANPPVCRILDYGKFKFDKDKKEREAKKNQKRTVIKEIRFTATTDKHDLETKAKAGIKFLQDGMKVKVAVFIKGRMSQRMDIVTATLNYFLDQIKDYGIVEGSPEMLGRDYFVMVSPKK